MINRFYFFTLIIGLQFLLESCTPSEVFESKPTLFKLLPADQTGIDFVNRLEYTEELNTYTYKNFYNGGGVALGDFNSDGLIDIFLSGNLVSNRLYLNKGNLHFEDITQTAGLESKGVWTTGVSVVDLNADGLLDIYLCKSGPPGGRRRSNELFINNGDLTFKEESKSYDLAFEGLSTHAAFFDFDKDGDLDCYLLNNSLRSVGGYDLRFGQRNRPDSLGGNKLLRNDSGKFVDISAEAGIFTSEIGFGLGVTIGDIDKDGWSDIYVSNDFFEKDYLYLNKKNGTFRECLEEYMQEISMGSMGADMADINNDGLPEVFVTEMLPEKDDRLKTTAQFESWDKYSLGLKSGYYRQFSRNVLQLNNGNGTFSEIGRLAGVEATDWSWGALIFDMDNDGLKDIYVANGIYKDLLDQDYVNFASNPEFVTQISQHKKGVITHLIDSIPSHAIPNYAFKNMGKLKFSNVAEEWGLGAPTFSNGSAYGDLDNDGDLDLVLNNVNMTASVYENQAKKLLPENASLTFVLHGVGKNLSALGTKITLKSKDQLFYQELSPMRGFMSTVDNRIIMGVGHLSTVDSVVVEWPDNRLSRMAAVKTNQVIELYQKDAKSETNNLKKARPKRAFFTSVPNPKGMHFTHVENEFSDFDRDRLLFNMISNEGPCLCTGDVNRDGLMDFYVGGAKDQSGALFEQKKGGTFVTISGDLLARDKASEDTGCTFLDANGDGLPDLYVTSGGFEFSSSSPALLNRLYFNMGQGKFKKSDQPLPVSTNFESTSTVLAQDYDLDGDMDLFVGARLIPLAYGTSANGYILNNDGKGNYTDVTRMIAPGLLNVGMITSGKWIDANNDKYPDLLIAGEWMAIKLFIYENGHYLDKSIEYGLGKSEGWYHSLEVGDFNKDGFIDFVVGNHGLNSRFKASERTPVSIYIKDFDQNGSIDHIITHYEDGKSYPFALKQDLVAQIPSLKKNFLHYRDYKEKTIADIFSTEQLKDMQVLNAFTFETSIWLNNGKGKFLKRTLPMEAQMFPVYAILIEDFTLDGHLDILLGGNLHRAKPETGIYAGGYGLLLKGDGGGNFGSVDATASGLKITGEIRSFQKIGVDHRKFVLVGRNNAELEILEY